MAEIMTELLKLHNLWDEQQKGTRSNIKGAADNLLVDRCMLEEVKKVKEQQGSILRLSDSI